MYPLMYLLSSVSPLIKILPFLQSTLDPTVLVKTFPQLPFEEIFFFWSHFGTWNRYHVNQPSIICCLVSSSTCSRPFSPLSQPSQGCPWERTSSTWDEGRCGNVKWRKTMELRGRKVSVLNKKSQGGYLLFPSFPPFLYKISNVFNIFSLSTIKGCDPNENFILFPTAYSNFFSGVKVFLPPDMGFWQYKKLYIY